MSCEKWIWTTRKYFQDSNGMVALDSDKAGWVISSLLGVVFGLL